MNSSKMTWVLLSIAGYDPSGGAGALMDVSVFEAAGFKGMAVLTALTVQNTREVRKVVPFPPQTILDQFRALAGDVAFLGIKVGMLGSMGNAGALGRILAGIGPVPVVIDPVLSSSSGAVLLPRASAGALMKAIRGRASLLTPNLSEAEVLSGLRVRSPEQMLAAGRAIFDRAGVPCLVTGGHLKKDCVNILWDGRKAAVFGSPKLPKDAHGTGCYLSASILVRLANGASLLKACADATEATREAIRRSARPGAGRFILKPV
jgi:hydroxymethylpyrimidine/phosphomethylpyrimidine kinase